MEFVTIIVSYIIKSGDNSTFDTQLNRNAVLTKNKSSGNKLNPTL